MFSGRLFKNDHISSWRLFGLILVIMVKESMTQDLSGLYKFSVVPAPTSWLIVDTSTSNSINTNCFAAKDGTTTNNAWEVKLAGMAGGQNVYTIRNVGANVYLYNTGRTLQGGFFGLITIFRIVSGGSSGNPAGNNNYLWRFVSVGDKIYNIYNQASGTFLYLADEQANNNRGYYSLFNGLAYLSGNKNQFLMQNAIDYCVRDNIRCGIGASCVNTASGGVCQCNSGYSGDPSSVCCAASLSCICGGDPHCYQFDKSYFTFMGRCKYSLVSTNCKGTSLPSSLAPFDVYQKHIQATYNPNIAFIKYIEVSLDNHLYRLPATAFDPATYVPIVTVDGAQVSVPYKNSNGTSIYQVSNLIYVFSSRNGLTVKWSTQGTVTVSLCDGYKNLVCGLCGNADGNSRNDYVDRNNVNVAIGGDYYTGFFQWGSSWRVNDPDSDPNVCPPISNPGTIQPITCKNAATYNTTAYCTKILDLSGPWTACTQYYTSNSPATLTGLINGCNFDMCALEGRPEQDSYRCQFLQNFNTLCNQLPQFATTKFNWRTSTNCPLPCGANSAYDVRAECPRNCLNPNGGTSCGLLTPTEACYCNSGYVMGPSGNCILQSQCGCNMPDGSGILSVGSSVISSDCTKVYRCNSPLGQVSVTTQSCGANAQCSISNNVRQCVCNSGYSGNGFTCTQNVDPCKSVQCGIGASCVNQNGRGVCVCNSGKVQNSRGYCCGLQTCTCGGDPHCTQFDKSYFTFMGGCKYELVSTNCKGNSLPSVLAPFVIYQKQVKSLNDNRIAFIQYIEISIFNSLFRLPKLYTGFFSKQVVSVNGVTVNLPYSDANGTQIVSVTRDTVLFTSSNGLSVKWTNGNVEVTLCDAYANNVCGLCGNANGNSRDDYVDRNNANVAIGGNYYTGFFAWGSSWRVNDPDSDQTICPPITDPGTVQPPTCLQAARYNSSSFCLRILDTNSPWSACTQFLLQNSPSLIKTMTYGCNFDLCALEGKPEQDTYRCNFYAQFTAACNNLAQFATTKFNWRTVTNCSLTCGANQVYDLRAECSKNCLNPTGSSNCGLLTPTEGCYCSTGYVLGSDGTCILPSQCGCKMPDGSGILDVNQNVTSSDCSKVYTCKAIQGQVLVTTQSCSSNAQCSILNGVRQCVCNSGYTGNGLTCTQNVDPCKSVQCGIGASCVNQNGRGVCVCNSGKVQNSNGYCCGSLFCTCYGDPHCTQFDTAHYSFMGGCKYQLVSTTCKGTSLPSALAPFEIYQKNIKDKVDKKIAYVDYVEISIGNRLFRLPRLDQQPPVATVNGIQVNIPYNSNGTQITRVALNTFLFTSSNGLSVKWRNGNVEVTLCDAYSGLVCGLCGNANGNARDDYVDRNNANVAIGTNFFTGYFAWGSSWRVNDPESDQSICPPITNPGTVQPPTCLQAAKYNSTENCLRILDANSPWASCSQFLLRNNPNLINTMTYGCNFDLCALEGKPEQNTYRCNFYAQFTAVCNNLAQFATTRFTWRTVTNCPLTCGANQVYDLRTECSRDCLNPTGSSNCGLLTPTEGCYCSTGYVLGSDGTCILPSQCGCKMPDGSGILDVNQSITSADCSKVFSCKAVQGQVTVTSQSCSSNAQCLVVNMKSTCVCNNGYSGNGLTCTLNGISVIL